MQVGSRHEPGQTNPSVLAVVPAYNVALSISNVIRQIGKSGVGEVLVVANGCEDETVESIRSVSGVPSKIRVHTLTMADRLGPDVPRSVGVYAALRCFPRWDYVVFVDGDWAGAFGPDLKRFIDTALEHSLDVAWVKASDMNMGSGSRKDCQLWRETLAHVAPYLQAADVSRAPLAVHRKVFNSISPFYLFQPGLWMAMCILGGGHLRLGAPAPLDVRLLGNPVRSSYHQQLMSETLIGDAIEGRALLSGLRSTREWQGRKWLGYHPERNIEILRQFSTSSAFFPEGPS